eukprot:353089-Chlamydomonas_euryale.AAC.3
MATFGLPVALRYSHASEISPTAALKSRAPISCAEHVEVWCAHVWVCPTGCSWVGQCAAGW